MNLQITLLMVLISQLPLYESKGFQIKIFKMKDTQCTFTGYVPGGNKVTVKRITAPIAKMEKDLMSGLVENLGTAVSGATEVINLLQKFGKLAKLAPKLAPALGLVSVGLDVVKSFTDPTLEDVLNAANKAIAKLTDEVNNRLDEMKGYVQQSVINLEKDLINRKYKSLFIFWGNCLKEVTKEKVNECQEDAVKDILAAKPEFAIFFNKVEANIQPSVYEVKRIEAALLSFRDYAVLSVASLSALTATYKVDRNKQAEYIRFANELNAEAKWIVKYAENAVSIILKMHTGGNNCYDTVKCNGMHQTREGFWASKVHTADWTYCTCVLDRADVSTRTCGYKVTIRKDGKNVYTMYEIPETKDQDAAKFISKFYLKTDITAYNAALKESISNYWNNELLDLVSSWRSFEIKLGKDQVLNENEIRASREVFKFSEDYERRDYYATQMVKDMNSGFKDNYREQRYYPRQTFVAQNDMARGFANIDDDMSDLEQQRFDNRRPMAQDVYGNIDDRRVNNIPTI